MRLAAIALVAVLAACHPPTLRSQARLLGHRFVATGQGIAHLAGRVNATIDPRAKVVVTQVAVASIAQAAQPPAAAQPQPVPDDSTPDDSVQDDSAAPASGAPVADTQPATMPAMTVHRVDAAPPATFRLNYRNSSGTWTCSSYPTMDQCTRACTAMGQQAGMSHGQDPQCNCVEDVACP